MIAQFLSFGKKLLGITTLSAKHIKMFVSDCFCIFAKWFALSSHTPVLYVRVLSVSMRKAETKSSNRGTDRNTLNVTEIGPRLTEQTDLTPNKHILH